MVPARAMMLDSTPTTLVELLQGFSTRQPDNMIYAFMEDGETETSRLTYGELDRRARAIAAWLENEGATGERALLLFPPGLDYIAAFFGCLYAGVVAVPVYPPRLNRPAARIQGIVVDAEATFALTLTSIFENLERRFEHTPGLATLRWLNTDTVQEGWEDSWQDPRVTADSLAFLQYTSGSTSTPKGVILSHGNLMHNLAVIKHGFQIQPGSKGIFWLPSYHDMGLIGGILEPLFVGASSVLMAPAAFLQRPIRWLEAISRYGGTISGAPNFAYQMCVDKITPDQCQGLDLSSWVTAFSGAEPIRLDTLDQFAERFGPYGFRREAFYPCYGLAEGTLLVAGGDGSSEPVAYTVRSASLGQNRAVAAGPDDEETLTLVGCGHALLEQRIAIVDPETALPRAEDEVGEIWVHGPSVAQGYWNRPEETAYAFQAYLADSGEGPFLRTGDLGFLHEGELYVTGRLKDLIIIRGRNHYPQDIEGTVAPSHEALEPGMGAAFSVTIDGEERLVVVHEVTRRHRKADVVEVAAAVRRAVAEQHELQLHALVLIKPLTIPRTSSGKIRRHACKKGYLNGELAVVGMWQASQSPAVARQAPTSPASPATAASAAAVEAWLVTQLGAQLKMAPETIDIHQPFVAYGVDSAQAVSLAGELESWLGRSLPATLVWDYPTIAALAQHLASDAPAQRVGIVEHERPTTEPVAIIGLGCRFPGAPTPDAFWRLLRDGIDAISEVPAERWDVDGYYSPDPAAPGKLSTRWGGFLDGVDQFDPDFFGISPREAARMDPQQRLLLEVAWEALEAAGQPPGGLAGSRTGVFVGVSSYDYSRLQFSDPDQVDAYAGTGNAHSIVANRLSYLLDLRGPSLAIDTACSSSLVAVHLALQSLRQGESDVALAGGVNLLLAPELTIAFSQARMMAADGRCKTFDAGADGYVRGEGCGVVVLKRLSDALRDGDNILALLRGSAVNQDGRSNGLTAPHGPSQQAVIREALAAAGVTPAAISYVEAHGTGTPLGDPIEMQSLRAVLETERPAEQRCLVGSVKTNIGHLEAAAGIAGLIKVVLALQHERIPPHLHFNALNPYISLDGSPLAVAAEGNAWQRGEQPRLAGVSSFGFGGTNAHVVVAEPPALNAPADDRRPEPSHHLLTLSARSETALSRQAARYAAWLDEVAEPALPDLCYTAQTGRDHFEHRLALVADSVEELGAQLADVARSGGKGTRVQGPKQPKIAFLFTGQGAQYPGMGRALYDSQPVFRTALEQCAEILRPYLDRPLPDILYPTGAGPEASLLHETAYTQPALFALEYALYQLWRSWGIEPDLVMGHSVGEFVAACIAGVFSLKDGLRLIAERGRLMGALPAGGAMAAVFATEEVIAPLIAPHAAQLALAAVNGPESVVISGADSAVEAVLETLAARGIRAHRLTVSHAFHSPLMEPVLAAFGEVAEGVDYHPPSIPLVANLTGRLWADGERPDAAYWCDHLRQPVQFAAGMQTLFDQGAALFLEIGPKPQLLSMGRRCLANDSRPVTYQWLPSLRENQPDWAVLLSSLGALYEAGRAINWAEFHRPYRRHKLPLPTYPFERQRYWLDEAPARGARPASPALAAAHPLLGPRLATAVPLFESQFDPGDYPEPAEVFREMALAAADALWGPGDHRLVGLYIVAGAPLPPGNAFWQTALTPAEGSFQFQIYRRPLDSEVTAWRLVAEGRVGAGEGEPLPAPTTAESLRDQLLAVEPAAQQATLEEILAGQISRVLGLNSAQLDRDRALDNLGLDSLMAIELKNSIERDLGLSLPVVELLQGPTVSGLAGQLVRQLAAPELAASAIERVTQPGEAQPLSYGQQALWFLHQLLPADLSFNVSGAVRLTGPLDVAALRAAFQALIDRHASLRTTFGVDGGQPMQRVAATMPAPFIEERAADWDAPALHEFLVREAHRPFDLERGPLLRLVLLHRAEQEHILLLALDHIITDFWSMSLLVGELSLLYQAGIRGTEVALPTLPVEYTDYVRWQADQLAGAEGERLWSYWSQQLAGPLPLLDLPTDRPRGALQTFRGDTVTHRLSPGLTARLKALSQAHGATLYMTLLAAFQVLLHRYTGQEDLLVGSVVAGRERPELAHLVGYFINPVALRADFSDDPDFATFLAQVRETVLAAFDHQAYPLPLLADRLALTRDPSRPPLFETMFILQKAQGPETEGLSPFALGIPGAELGLADLTVSSLAVGGQPAQFDLTLMMAEMDEGLAASLHYNCDLFEPATAARLLAQLESLLTGIVAAPEQPVSHIPLLTVDDRERLLVDWNATATDFPRERCLHQLFETQAGLTPNRVAVVGDDETLTYAELNRRANRLAARLQRLGAGPETLVAIAVERSAAMLVGLLGILKAGAAYVPLDPAFPPARLALMLEDAAPAVLVTQRSLSGRFEPFNLPELIYLDELPETNGRSEINPVTDVKPDNLAYVIFTSGSTGRPKGVQIPHRAVVNFLTSMRRQPGLGPDDILLAVTTLSFDIAVLELFLPLICGGRVVVAGREVVVDGDRLMEALERSGATVMQATPAGWQLLLEAGWAGRAGLKMLCGGEALPRPLADALLVRGSSLWNLYGPTETTVWSTCDRVMAGAGPVPIGRPIANTQIYLLDRHLQPVPPGAAGEIYIGGDGVARGYLGRPELTAERFVDDPFGGEPDGRLYKTGDLARYLPDGTLLYLGRSDQQVKVRGFRIELGEIEGALAAHPAVGQAAVVARESGYGATTDRHLVAYLVPAGDTAPLPESLRDALRRTLPDYMIPAFFVTLDALPLTPNGKIDRQALPAPAEPLRNRTYIAPRNDLERELAALCREVLGIKSDDEAAIGVDDNFFDLGGNSLLATRLIFRVRETFQVQVALRHLFTEPTVAGLARAIEMARQAPDEAGDEKASGLFPTVTAAMLNADAVLDPVISATGLAWEPAQRPAHLLLTGATGFLGAFLLRDLLRETEATVHCLVRAESAAEGQRRLADNLRSYNLWSETFAERIVAHPGDLSRPRLGLADVVYAQLADIVDAIYHNGALVNFVYPYEAHKAANVGGTVEVLRLATQCRLKAVHFVSTLSVFHTGSHNDGTIFHEGDSLDESGVPFGGYAQSKWVAEKLVMTAAERGIPAVIYRPGMISGHSETGAWNDADMMSTLARASIAIGSLPALDVMVDVVPVDYVSRAIVHLSQQSPSPGQIFHLANPRPMPYQEMIAWLRERGFSLAAVPFPVWREQLFALAAHLAGDEANPYLPLLEEVTEEQVFMPAIDCQNTLTGLAESNVACPPVGPALLNTYLARFSSAGWRKPSSDPLEPNGHPESERSNHA